MSAIDSLLDFLSEQYKDVNGNIAAARSELAELESSRAELMARLAAYGDVESPDAETVLAPRKCVAGRACYRKGWDAAREAAAGVSCWSCSHDIPMTSETIGNRTFNDIHTNGVICTAIKILDLVPPDDCGGACNPLEPDVVDTCGACKNFKRCEFLFGCKTDDIECDWYPSRFERA